MTDPTTTATAEITRPVRRRGVFRLDEEILARIIDLPDGQRIIGFRADSARLCIDVCVEGEGLPECAPAAEPRIVNAGPYVTHFGRWAYRGSDLAEMVEALAELYATKGGFDIEVEVADDLRSIMAGKYDPRTGIHSHDGPDQHVDMGE